jgi:hypothetical protein
MPGSLVVRAPFPSALRGDHVEDMILLTSIASATARKLLLLNFRGRRGMFQCLQAGPRL